MKEICEAILLSQLVNDLIPTSWVMDPIGFAIKTCMLDKSNHMIYVDFTITSIPTILFFFTDQLAEWKLSLHTKTLRIKNDPVIVTGRDISEDIQLNSTDIIGWKCILWLVKRTNLTGLKQLNHSRLSAQFDINP